MLDLLHIEEVSYEGNDKVLGEWFRLLQVDPTGQQLLVWVGDQLTFHAQIVMEHSLHSQFYGTHAGHGLVHAFKLLKRKGLHSPSVQGMYHQNIKEALNHIAAAHFRDLWCTVAQVESLSKLKELHPETLQMLAIQIVREFASRKALDAAACRSQEEQDDVLSQAILWNKDILDYIALNSAVSCGDVGTIQDLLP
ncbi:hypothetical protein BC827DRAFT_1158993 [Russula dissimulans]|nr:hypothetical protein BC827DRAFT_1158993 [Russula dissimulans]